MTIPGRAPAHRAAFTLLELIVVITIIGLLSTIVVTATGGIMKRARATRAEADMKAILSAAKVIYTTTGRYPESIFEMVEARDNAGERIGIEEYRRDPWERSLRDIAAKITPSYPYPYPFPKGYP